jgi:hypothetical protein
MENLESGRILEVVKSEIIDMTMKDASQAGAPHVDIMGASK